MLENGDHANLVFAFLRPHAASMSVLNTHSQPQTASPRIITTNQMALNAVMHLPFAECFQNKPLVNPRRWTLMMAFAFMGRRAPHGV
jgi:hypothetical protein